jgi:arsenate reductase
MEKPLILVLCTGNSCRSHMAEAILRHSLGAHFRIDSAGSRPAEFVHPLAIEAMKEIDYDLSGHRSKHLGEFMTERVETVITVCGKADQACPIFPGQVNRHHFPFEDPADVKGTRAEQLAAFRQVRDEIRRVFEAYAAGRLDAIRSR